MKKIIYPILIVFAVIIIGVIAVVFSPKKKSEKFIRSVTALRLTEIDPVEKIKLTGVVKAWKEEDLSFELNGKVNWITEKGVLVNKDSEAYKLSLDGSGDIIAIIDDKKYELKLKTAESQLKAAQAQLEALKIEVNEVLKQQLEALKAGYENSQKELLRFRKLIRDNAISQKVLDQSEANYKIAFAKFKEIEALEIVKKAELKVSETNIEELQQMVNDAKLDLQKTVLRAPFQGKISEIFTNIGAYVRAGDKVAHLVSMDPITVILDVSPEIDRKFNYGDFVYVYPPGLKKPFLAMINRKAVSADPRTHTFEMELILHNRMIKKNDIEPDSKSLVKKIDHVWPIIEINHKGKPRQILLDSCIYTKDGKSYAWKVETENSKTNEISLYRLTKINLELEPEEHSIFGIYKYRVLKTPYKGKKYEMFASGVPGDIKNGDIVTIFKDRWMYRPGDLVNVLLSSDFIKSGLYLPADSICSNSSEFWVFKAVKNSDGTYTAKKIPVEIAGNFNNFLMIKSDLIKKGDFVIDNGSQFIQNNEIVNVNSISRVQM